MAPAMRYSIIARTSQTLAGPYGSGESQKAADGERDIDQVEHEPIPLVDIGPIDGFSVRKGAIPKTVTRRKNSVRKTQPAAYRRRSLVLISNRRIGIP